MKAIVAYIQPFMEEKVTDALRIRRIHGATVFRGEGFGRLVEGKTPHYEDASVALGYAPKTRIEMVCRDEEAESIVQTILNLARTLSLRVVAEGVETTAQLAQLQALGCHCHQGYHFARPMPVSALADWVQRAGGA